MADQSSRLPENTPGAWFVDDQCIDCDLCRQEAPGNFSRDAGNYYSYVSSQPDNDEELAACHDAMEGCPVEAIGCLEKDQ